MATPVKFCNSRSCFLHCAWLQLSLGYKFLQCSTVGKMGLNIKNDETCRLAREVAELTGDTMTGAITVALRERRERVRQHRRADILARELHAIGQRCAGLLRPGPSAVEHGDLLYDERGLPK